MSLGIINTPEELFDLAKLGQKLKPKQRQSVVSWLESSGKIEEIGEFQLAKILQCKPAAVREYVKKARGVLAQAITSEDAMAYMVNFLRSYDIMIKEAKDNLLDPKMKGTGLQQGYMRLLKELEAEKIEKLQSIGVIPKELGRLTAIKEEWTATVSESGVASVGRTGEDGDDA
jgi:predicted transcriptional regulator